MEETVLPTAEEQDAEDSWELFVEALGKDAFEKMTIKDAFVAGYLFEH